jgi:hypothetical protein
VASFLPMNSSVYKIKMKRTVFKYSQRRNVYYLFGILSSSIDLQTVGILNTSVILAGDAVKTGTCKDGHVPFCTFTRFIC